MITISHLSKKFGTLCAVDDLSLDIHAGEILGLLGPNGAGKTTTIRMLCGLLQKDSGQIHWEGSAELFSSMGFCPQENLFWPRLTCLEQLVFMGQMHRLSRLGAWQRGLHLLAVLGLSQKQNTLAAKLSGGMKRRLNIALALIHDPEVLILDEPEAGLDPQSRILVRDLIKSLARHKTVILTTHNMDEAERLSDRVAIIDKGKLLALGSVDDLKQSMGEDDILEIRYKDNLEAHDSGQNSIIQSLRQALEHLPGVDGSQINFLADKLVLRTSQALQKLSRVTELGQDLGLEIIDIQLRKATLEDVFIHLTGRALRE